MATTNPITKITRQHEATWSQLHKRVSSPLTYDFGQLFPDQLVTFLHQKATSLNTSIAYFVPSLLTTTAFLLPKNGATLYALNHEQQLNIYMMFIGHPGTGKSSAIQHACLRPITHSTPMKFPTSYWTGPSLLLLSNKLLGLVIPSSFRQNFLTF